MFFYFYEEFHWDFDKDYIESQVGFDKMGNLIILIILIYEQIMYFHFRVSS